jgi:hypothetical protein
MAGINATGKPRTTDYRIGRGSFYLAPLSAGVKTSGYRNIGNCPEFTVTLSQESLEHTSTQSGLAVTDVSVVTSQTMELAFSLDEFSLNNLSIFLAGTTTTGTNSAVAGFAEYEMIASVTKGLWYDIVNASGVRAYNIDATDLTVAVGATTLVLNTDYELDLVMGRIFFIPGSVDVSDTDAIDVTLAAEATAGAIQQTSSLDVSSKTYALKYIEINPVNNDVKREWEFDQVRLTAEGDISLIGDEFSTMPFSGAAERNSVTGKSLTVTYPVGQTA